MAYSRVDFPDRVLSPRLEESTEYWTQNLTLHTTCTALVLATLGIYSYSVATNEGLDLVNRLFFNDTRLNFFAEGLRVVPITVEFSLIIHYVAAKVIQVRASRVRHAQEWLENGLVQNGSQVIRTLSNEGTGNRFCKPNITFRIIDLMLALLGAGWLIFASVQEKPDSLSGWILDGSRLNHFSLGLIASTFFIESALMTHRLVVYCLNRRIS